MRLPSASIDRQRGAVALAITLVLFFVMALVATFVNRNLIFEQRSSSNQYRSTQAFEAAEAGLQWAEAQLNSNQRLDADCAAAVEGGAGAGAGANRHSDSFRERHLRFDASSGMLTPATWDQAGVPMPLLPSCVRSGTGWSCSCPGQGPATLVSPDGDNLPAFSLQMFAGSRPGIIRIVATGCNRLAAPCQAGSAVAADATARVEASLGLLGALRVPPSAALTVVGSVSAGGAAVTVENPDPASGIAIQAGQAVDASQAHVTGPLGSPAAAAAVEHDAALAAMSADHLFASYFGMSKARWKAQPAVTQVICSTGCASALAQAIDDRVSSGMIWVDGDLEVTGPATFGTPERPVVIVVNGTAHLRGAVAVQGVVYAGSVTWDEATGGGSPGGSAGNAAAGVSAAIHGALVSEAGYQGSAAPRLTYDPAVLNALIGFAGSFARISGSWRDY